MADIFVSYSRSDKTRVAPLVAAIKAKGWSVWWDPSIAAGQQFDDQIEAELLAASAVLVVWTPASVLSRWVRGEARDAAERGILVPVRFDNARLPIDARAIQTTDLDNWGEDPASAPFQDLLLSLSALIERQRASKSAAPAATSASSATTPRVTICVLPFANMSGDQEQEYFADGITEDIITDLSKVSTLAVTARNTSFVFKGKAVDLRDVVRRLDVSHVLEGSVRKSGDRLRITAQLIDGVTGAHIWAERYDRHLDDVFALQDELAGAIVSALKVKLLPGEKRAIEQRGTNSAEAYKLYLMARQYRISGNLGTARCLDALIRLCQRAVEIDPKYARAWALIAVGQGRQRLSLGRTNDGGWAAANQALALDPNLAEARAARAQVLTAEARYDEARREVDAALALDPESYEVNFVAGRWFMTTRRFREAIGFFEKAAALEEAASHPVLLLMSCLRAIADDAGARRMAPQLLARAEKVALLEPDNGMNASCAVDALCTLGEVDRANEWIDRSLILDPENLNMRYNFACSVIVKLHDFDRGLDLLELIFQKHVGDSINWIKNDADLDPVRDMPRFKAMLAKAEERVRVTASGAARTSAKSSEETKIRC